MKNTLKKHLILLNLLELSKYKNLNYTLAELNYDDILKVLNFKSVTTRSNNKLIYYE